MDEDIDNYFNQGFDDNEFEVPINEAEMPRQVNNVQFSDYNDAKEETIKFVDVESDLFEEAQKEYTVVLERLRSQSNKMKTTSVDSRIRHENSNNNLTFLLCDTEKISKFEKGD